jgi:hypothetical protein
VTRAKSVAEIPPSPRITRDLSVDLVDDFVIRRGLGNIACMDAVFEENLGEICDSPVFGEAKKQVDILDHLERAVLADGQHGVAPHHDRRVGDRCDPLAR